MHLPQPETGLGGKRTCSWMEQLDLRIFPDELWPAAGSTLSPGDTGAVSLDHGAHYDTGATIPLV